jgi:hypothetical protein
MAAHDGAGALCVEDLAVKLRWKSLLVERYRYRHIPDWMLLAAEVSALPRRLFRRYPLHDKAESLSCRPLFIVGSGFSYPRLLDWPDLVRLVVSLFETQTNFPLWDTSLIPAYRASFELPAAERSLARVIDEVFACYRDQNFPDAQSWGDQSPLNTLNLSRVRRTFPQARYLHLLRNPLDVVASMVEFGRTAEEATTRWCESIRQVKRLERRIDAEQFLQIRYEDLVTDPEPALRRVCTFTGVTPQEQMLDFWKLPSTLEWRAHPHHQNLQKPLFTTSVGSWRSRLSAEQQQLAWAKTAPLARALGYVETQL